MFGGAFAEGFNRQRFCEASLNNHDWTLTKTEEGLNRTGLSFAAA